MSTAVLPGKLARQRLILREARRRPALRIAELARALEVSGETIRRDLDDLSRAGALRRIYGGATLPDQNATALAKAGTAAPDVIPERSAAAAAARVEAGQTVILSGGAAAPQLARHLASRAGGLTLITNSVAVAAAAGSGAAEVVLCPGRYDLDDDSVTGEDTVEYLGRFHADLAILTCSGLSTQGASDNRRSIASVKRAMLRAARRSILVAGAAQFGENALQSICRLDALAEIIAGDALPPDIAEACRRAEVRVTSVLVEA